MSEHPINPYEPPLEPQQPTGPAGLPIVQRHPFLSALGWLVAIAGTAVTGGFVYFTVLLLNLYHFEHWMGVLAILTFALVFGTLASAIFVFLGRATPKQNRWANVLPAFLWTVGLVIAGEVTFFTVCTMVS
jgi:hypothetical protein